MKKDAVGYEKITQEYFESVKEKGLSQNLCKYVWLALIAISRGYSFNASHTLSYSIVALQEMNLAYKFPIVYWNTACLIVDAGGDDSNTDYSKVAKAVSTFKSRGIEMSLVNINESDFSFKPDVAHNRILFGFKGMQNIGDELVRDIIANRPYKSMLDFYYRVKPRQQAMIALIKGGAFDCFEPNRYKAMVEYIWETCEKKKKLTLRNIPMLAKKQLIPQETDEQKKAKSIYEFNRYLKDQCRTKGNYYQLDSRALDFLTKIDYNNYDDDKKMNCDAWDKDVYQKEMDVFRNWMVENKDAILDKLNTEIFLDDWYKYADSNLSAWEMEVMCFYYHEHELKNANFHKYGIDNFEDLQEAPIVETVFTRGDTKIPIYKLNIICGTCIAKDKNKAIVWLLTPQGKVVSLRFNREYFAMYDRQLSQRNPDGTKTVLEKSWFTRGNKIVVQGMRRGDEFVSKKYKHSRLEHQLYHIDKVEKNGDLVLRHERYSGGEVDIEDV